MNEGLETPHTSSLNTFRDPWKSGAYGAHSKRAEADLNHFDWLELLLLCVAPIARSSQAGATPITCEAIPNEHVQKLRFGPLPPEGSCPPSLWKGKVAGPPEAGQMTTGTMRIFLPFLLE